MAALSTALTHYLYAIWRRRWLSIAVAWTVCVLGWVGVALMPNVYESEARVHVDADALVTQVLHGLAVDVDPTQQLDLLQRTLLSRSNLEQLIHMADLDRRINSSADTENLIQQLADRIALKSQTRNLFSITFQDKDPTTARNVVQSLVTIFAENSTGTSRSQMDNAQHFLGDELAKYEAQLRAAEKRRAEFREAHLDVVAGGASAVNLEGGRVKLEQMRAELQDALARREALQKELATVPPVLSVDGGGPLVINGNGEATTVEQRLAQAQRQLADLRSRYTDQHPDVIALKSEIEDLKKEAKASPITSGDTGSTRHSQVANTVYEQVKIRLVEAESQVASLQHRVADAETDLKRLQAIAQASPGIEAQAQDLDRDYDIIKKNYEELLARRESTNLAQAADNMADKIQFRVVDAPQLPTAPVAPNRFLLCTAVLLGGVLGGVAIAVLLMQVDRSFATPQGLRNLGLPVLGSVSFVQLPAGRAQSRLDLARFGAATLGLFLCYGVILAVSVGIHRSFTGSGML